MCAWVAGGGLLAGFHWEEEVKLPIRDWTNHLQSCCRTIQAGAILNILGTIVQASSVGLYMMLVGRIISGFAVGFTQTAVPIYLAECATAKNRGYLTGYSQLMVTLGFVATSWIGYAAFNVPNADHNAFTWRFPISIAAVPSIFIAFALNWLPESPRYLVRQGMTEEAYRVLSQLYFNGSNRIELQREIHQITIKWNREMLECGQNGDSEWKLCFTVPKYRTRLIVAILSQVLTQCTGINLITYYQSDMYRADGMDQNRILFLGAIYTMVAPVTCFFSQFFLIDRIGRKKMLYFGSITLPLLFIAFAIAHAENEKADYKKDNLTRFSIAIMFIFNVVFNLSWGVVGWVMFGEVLPLRIRGKGAAIAAGLGNWAVNCLISQISPMAMDRLKWRYYFFYSVFSKCPLPAIPPSLSFLLCLSNQTNIFLLAVFTITLPLVHFLFKETKGLSLEDLDSLWENTPVRTYPSLEEGFSNGKEAAGKLPAEGTTFLSQEGQLELAIPGSRFQRGRFAAGVKGGGGGL